MEIVDLNWVDENTDMFDLDTQSVLNPARVLVGVHPRSACTGRPCCIHAPSAHHMADWRMEWRDDMRMMERICEHGVGHPDPDHLAYVLSLTKPMTWHSIHTCCLQRCCTPAEELRAEIEEMRS